MPQDVAESIATIRPPKRLPLPELVRLACEDYNQRLSRREDSWEMQEASPDSDKAFLDRICVNYLRHASETGYDEARYQEGKVGGDGVYEPVRRKVFKEIAKVYPELAEECRRQKGY